MFRTLAARLTATYVFAAILLVVVVLAATTAFALSTFAVATRDAAAAVARQIPDEMRLELQRHRSLREAAPDIVHHLDRPGLRIVIFSLRGQKREFLAGTGDADAMGRPTIAVGDRPPPSSLGPPPPDGARGPRMGPFPFGLDRLLHLEPHAVEVAGARIVVFPDPEPLAKTINSFWLAMLPIGAFVTVAAWLLGRFITGQALRPLAQTTASLRRFGEGDFTPSTIESSARNEIGDLASAYNAAAAQVARAFEERRAAELQMRQFVTDAGHELRTPLTVIMGFVDVLRRRSESDPASTRIYDTMLAESRRMRSLIEKLIVLSRLEHPQAAERLPVDLAEIAERVASAVGARGEDASRLQLSSAGAAFVRGDENELYDAVSNLVENALKYTLGPVVVNVRGENGSVLLDVVDRGPGIPAEERARVFDRFYRGRGRDGETEGFGLGLAIAKRAVERTGGVLVLESPPGSGCRFTIRAPRTQHGDGGARAV